MTFRYRILDLCLALMILICLTAFGFKPGPVFAQELTIATGKTGGGYDRRALQIAQRLGQGGLAASVLNLNGSDEVSLALCGGRAQIGLMQIDAIYARSLEGCQMKAVGSYGSEVALILFPPRSKLAKLSDLQSGSAVLVDTVGSGSELFWRTIVRIETGDQGSNDGWSQARAVNDPLELANTSAEMGEIDAVILVRKPDSADVQGLLGQGWKLGELWDRDLDNLKFNGAALYLPSKLQIPMPGGKSAKAWGYEVRSFVVVPRSIAEGDRIRFAAITASAQ